MGTRKNLALIYLSFIIVAGVKFLIDAASNLKGLDIPLIKQYILVFYSEMGLMFLVTVLSGVVLIGLLLKGVSFASRWKDKLESWYEKNWVIDLIVLILSILGFSSGQMLFQIQITENLKAEAFLIGNKPFYGWVVLFCLATLLFIFLWVKAFKKIRTPDVYLPAIIFLILLAMLVCINLSPYGFSNSYRVGDNFRLTGFPVLGYQIFLAWLLVILGSISIYWLWRRWGKRKEISPVLIDVFLGAVLFIGAFLVWQNAPILANAFIDKPRPPNYEFYPNLDAVVYDRTALNLLSAGKFQTYINNGESLWVGRRPLLSSYLAGLHWLSGGDYSKIITMQLAFFSLLPVLIYLFTKTLHNRLSGMLAAIVIMIRQLNGVWLSDDVWGGTSLHMLMSDILATMAVVFFLYLILLWINDSEKGFFYPLICGGVLGLGMLIRQELIALVVLAFIILGIMFGKTLRKFFGQFALMLVGLVIVISPWVTRNAILTGHLYLGYSREK